MIKKKFFGANLKLHFNHRQMCDYLDQWKKLSWNKQHDIILFPNHLNLSFSQQVLKEHFTCIGAQNAFFEDQGAFTGEISLKMIADETISYVLLGHSERRNIFFEPDLMIKKKVEKALDLGLSIVLCVGEHWEHRQQNQAKDFIQKQLENVLLSVEPSKSQQIIIAYEPIWAIGTGKTAKKQDIIEMSEWIVYNLKHLGFNINQIRLIYGGSVNQESIADILSIPSIDGILVGSASLIPSNFFNLTLR